MSVYEQYHEFPKQLKKEEIEYVEQTVLKTPKTDWSFEDLDLFSLWFYECGSFYKGSKYLMRDHPFKAKIKGREIWFYHKGFSNLDDGADTVQEWLIKFWGKLDFNPDDGDFDAYFKTGIKLQAQPEVKKKRRLEEIDSVNANGVTLLQMLEKIGKFLDLSCLHNMSAMEAKEIIEKALEKVDENDINVRAFLLHNVHGFKYEEIAQIEGIELNTVKVRINRGREKLRRVVEEILKEKDKKDKEKGNNEEVK